MASDAGISTNTLLVVAALGVVAVVLYRRQGAASYSGAAPATRATGMAGSGFTREDVKTLTEAAIGLGTFIGSFVKDDEAPEAPSDMSYLESASPDAKADCVARGKVYSNGEPTRECVESYG